MNYIHDNPVRYGIAEKPEDYLYSSARNYAGLKGLIIGRQLCRTNFKLVRITGCSYKLHPVSKTT